MKELLILSGKGGTGKTSMTASITELINNSVVADCDVDASNLPIMLGMKKIEEHSFYGGEIAEIGDDCINCGYCESVCRFDAIKTGETKAIIDQFKCEGCGFCSQLCPVETINLKERFTGKYFISLTNSKKYLCSAELEAGSENSGKLVTQVKKTARDIAEKENADYLIIDGPPGICCPAIASLAGTDILIIVTESSYSGFHDLKRVLQLTKKYINDIYVIINKADINFEITREIKNHLQKENIPAPITIDYNMLFSEAVNKCIPPINLIPALKEKLTPFVNDIISENQNENYIFSNRQQ